MTSPNASPAGLKTVKNQSDLVPVVLVDDSKMMLAWLVEILRGPLQKRGYAIDPCDGFFVALTRVQTHLQAAKKELPIVVLSDFILEKGHTGLELAQMVQNLVAPTVFAKHTYSAILTQGGLSPGDSKRAAEINCPVFQKPEKGNEAALVQSVTDWLLSLS